jgi:hypothetical protein
LHALPRISLSSFGGERPNNRYSSKESRKAGIHKAPSSFPDFLR